MRQKPNLMEGELIACLHRHYGLHVLAVDFLPLGYDLNAFVYEAVTEEEDSYFVKVRRGAVHPASLIVPRLLIEQGVPNILAPLRTQGGGLWCSLESYSVMVYPFIRGTNAMEAGLSERQWREFGATLRAIHTGHFAAQLGEDVSSETFAIPSAALVWQWMRQIEGDRFESPAARELVTFCLENASLIQHLLTRAEALGRILQQRSFEYVLCHADIHAANILVSGEGGLYLVDWDGPMLAPRERDLLFVVGSKIARPVERQEEELFFEGYGQVEIDRTALAYYRYERVIEDIGVIGEGVFWDGEQSEEMKAGEVALFRSQFAPGGMVESALEADREQGGVRNVIPF